MMARRIQDVCIGASQPLILAPENASTLIYAVESFGGYDLHLGNPNDEPDYPTLRDFIEERGFDPDDDDSLREYVIEWRGYAEDFDEEEEGQGLRTKTMENAGRVYHNLGLRRSFGTNQRRIGKGMGAME